MKEMRMKKRQEERLEETTAEPSRAEKGIDTCATTGREVATIWNSRRGVRFTD